MSLITLTLSQGFNTWWFEKVEPKEEPVDCADSILRALKMRRMTKTEVKEETGLSDGMFARGIAVLKDKGAVTAYRRTIGPGAYVKVWGLQ